MMRISYSELSRFFTSGVINTIASYGIYALLLQVTNYQIAFTIAFIFGTIISYALNTLYTFAEDLKFSKFLSYLIFYTGQYIFCLFVLYLLVDLWHLNKHISLFILLFISIPFNFFLTSFIIKS